MKKIFLLTFIAITLPLLLFAFVGCMKKPEIKADYGPEVAISDIQKSINNQTTPDLESIKLGQYISLDETQAIDVQSPFSYYQRLDEVTNYENKDGVTKLHFKVTTNELIDGKWTATTQDDLPVFFKNAKTTAINSLFEFKFLTANNSKNLLTIESVRKSDAAAGKKITYHNLVEETGITPIPPSVSKKPDCGGLSAIICGSGLRFYRVKFDKVTWDSEEHGTKTTFTFTYSPDVPTYIDSWDNMAEGLSVTKQVRGCVQTWLEIDNGSGGKQTVPVQNCAELRDFQFGHD